MLIPLLVHQTRISVNPMKAPEVEMANLSCNQVIRAQIYH